MSETTPLLAGVELGGTKCVCILGTGPEEIVDEVRIPTADPEATLAAIERVLEGWREQGRDFAALGIASFGPVDLDRSSTRYGYITSTPKPGWRDTDVAQRLAARVNRPTAFDTDVNGAALAEGRWGGARGLTDFAYVTVGTGVGVGLVTAGRPILGFTHAEAGHLRVARAPGDDWPGNCPYHGACVEGLAAGIAVEARTGLPAAALAPNHPVWPLVAHALAQMLHALVLTAAPRRILMGGGVMNAQPQLFPMIRKQLVDSLNNYVVARELADGLDDYVVLPELGDRAGPLGALALAADAIESV
jgi:fructokinase